MNIKLNHFNIFKSLILATIFTFVIPSYGEDSFSQYGLNVRIRSLNEPLNSNNKESLSQNELNALLYNAVKKADLEEVKQLIKVGANPNAIDKNGDTVLTLAIRKENLEIVLVLLQAKAFPDAIDVYAPSPLYIAYKRFLSENDPRKIRIVEALLKAGADFKILNEYGNPALHTITQKGSLILAKAFIKAGADPLAKSGQAKSSYDIAKENINKNKNFKEIVQIFEQNIRTCQSSFNR